MALENFTTYTEVDPNSHIEKTENHIDFTYYANESAYLYKDKSEGYFGSSWTHSFEFKVTDGGTSGSFQMWCLANTLGDTSALPLYLLIFGYHFHNPPIYIYLREHYNGSNYQVSWDGASLNTTYYLTVTKTGLSLTCKIYSDPERTNLLADLEVTLQADHSFRYIFGCVSNNGTSSSYTIGEIDNLELNSEPPPPPPPESLISQIIII